MANGDRRRHAFERVLISTLERLSKNWRRFGARSTPWVRPVQRVAAGDHPSIGQALDIVLHAIAVARTEARDREVVAAPSEAVPDPPRAELA
jgi:hypothetical protein